MASISSEDRMHLSFRATFEMCRIPHVAQFPSTYHFKPSSSSFVRYPVHHHLPPPTERSNMALPKWSRNPFVVLGGLTLYAGSATAVYLTLYEPKHGENVVRELSNAERRAIFNANAAKYDREINRDEWLVGISLMRRCLLRQARGRVLEIAAGTGRNVQFYPKATTSHITLTDFSENMLHRIVDKPQFQAADNACHDRFDMQVMSAEALAFADQSFDTVVDTFGLCSMNDPVASLREMQRVCKQPDGRILLLEHGRSASFTWLSTILDKFAGLHAEKWGCHWNRDILQLVQDAGLEIERMHRFHFGTTYYIIAKPKHVEHQLEDKQQS